MNHRFLYTPLILLSGLLASAPVLAADPPNGTGQQVLQISPVREDISISSGTKTTREVTITNKLANSVRLQTQFQNVLSNGELGQLKDTSEPSPYDLRQFATVSESEFTLNGNESRKVVVTLEVPAGASPGGYYGWLRFAPTNRTDAPNVAIQGSVATLFLVRVPGPAKEAGSIKELYTTRPDGRKTDGFLLGSDLVAIARLNNDGNVHFPATPTFTAYNQFGKEVFTNQASESNIFPGATRRFEAQWNDLSTGYYRLEIKENFPGTGEQQRSVRILVVSPMAAMVAIGVLVLLVILMVRARLNRKRPAKK